MHALQKGTVFAHKKYRLREEKRDQQANVQTCSRPNLRNFSHVRRTEKQIKPTAWTVTFTLYTRRHRHTRARIPTSLPPEKKIQPTKAAPPEVCVCVWEGGGRRIILPPLILPSFLVKIACAPQFTLSGQGHSGSAS